MVVASIFIGVAFLGVALKLKALDGLDAGCSDLEPHFTLAVFQ